MSHGKSYLNCNGLFWETVGEFMFKPNGVEYLGKLSTGLAKKWKQKTPPRFIFIIISPILQ